MKLSKTSLLCAVALGIVWLSATSSAQTFTILKSFGNLTNITGHNPRSQLALGPDGTLYGTTPWAEGSLGNVHGTVFKIQPDGNGFAVLKWFTNSVEGEDPEAGLTLSGNVLYGTTARGGSNDWGTVFRMNTDGTDYTVLKHFSALPGDGGFLSALTLSGSVLYGTTFGGANSMPDTVFKLNTDGTSYAVLKEFAEGGGTGLQPSGRLALSGDVLYGTTTSGGSSNGGTVFQINTDGTGYRNLKEFPSFPGDGVSPSGGLALSDGVLYGTTARGGSNGWGTVFKLSADGTGYTVLKEFTGSDGTFPREDLILSGRVLYGMSFSTNGTGEGAVFKVNTDGTGFAVLKQFIGSDGTYPQAGLTLLGSVLYGTTFYGGSGGEGVVFKVNTDGTGFAVLMNFRPTTRDAIHPQGGLALSGVTLYGTTGGGGISNWGTVFRVNTDGTGYSVLKEFGGSPSDGAQPRADLTSSGGVLYGTTLGSVLNTGTVFNMNTDGTGYTVLKAFSGGDGDSPWGGLALSGDVLYGTTYYGGRSNAGTVFKVNTDGTGHSVLKQFTRSPSDGAFPNAGVTVSGSVLYGTTSWGGSANYGTVFKLNTDGTGFTLLKSFADGDGISPRGLILSGGVLYGTADGGGNLSSGGTLFKVNTDGTGYTALRRFSGFPDDGARPNAVLAVSAGVLYGTTVGGGSSNYGTLFKINMNGTGYSVLKHFTGSDGAYPYSGLTLSGGTLYGTTSRGGSLGLGTVFKLELSTPISLNAQSLGSAIILRWSNPAFALQAAPAVTGPYTNIPSATSPYINAISEPQRFFRLVGAW